MIDFYGIGKVSLAEKEPNPLSTQKVRNRRSFGLTIQGDLQGSVFLLTEDFPVESDPSSALELLNILSARLADQLSSEGLDIVISAPLKIDSKYFEMMISESRPFFRLWSGRFSGNNPFEFELIITAERTQVNESKVMFRQKMTVTQEEALCSHLSLDS